MSDTAVSPCLKVILWLCDHHVMTFSQAEDSLLPWTYVEDGLRQFVPMEKMPWSLRELILQMEAERL